ncbi:MAG: helix-turn-helix domain-containing protein [bacterium]|nr:helix-turn-helix domain-containing protein [bacterium]
MPEIKVDIGERIKDLRQAAELTQEELAERAELSKGFISQVERGLTNLSIENLVAILSALDVSLPEFFATPVQERVVYGQEDVTEVEREGVTLFELLVPGAANRSMEPAMLVLAPGEAVEAIKPYSGDEFGYLLEGRLKIHHGGAAYLLNAGEWFFYSAKHKHYFENPGHTNARLLWITSPPNF